MSSSSVRLMKASLTSVLSLCAALFWFTSSPDRARSSEDPAKHALAVCLVSEAGWHSPDDYSAILHVLSYRKSLPYWRERPMLDLVRAYCQVLRYPRRQGGWIMAWPLGEPDSRPEGFPDGLDHRRYVRHWVRVQHYVDRFLAGQLPHRCTGTPHQWGAPSLLRPNWHRLDCGTTQNVFYSER